jgi:hypothetical protein
MKVPGGKPKADRGDGNSRHRGSCLVLPVGSRKRVSQSPSSHSEVTQTEQENAGGPAARPAHERVQTIQGRGQPAPDGAYRNPKLNRDLSVRASLQVSQSEDPSLVWLEANQGVVQGVPLQRRREPLPATEGRRTVSQDSSCVATPAGPPLTPEGRHAPEQPGPDDVPRSEVRIWLGRLCGELDRLTIASFIPRQGTHDLTRQGGYTIPTELRP